MLKNSLFSLLACVLLFNPQIYGQKKFTLSDKIDFAKKDAAQKDVPIEIEKEEPSAIVPIEDGKYFLAANDKNLGLTVISNDTRKKVGTANCTGKTACENFPQSSPKWEAMAKDGDDIYAAGAYRKNDTTEKFLLRFKVRKVSESIFEIYWVERILIDALFKKTTNGNSIWEIKDSDPRIEGLAVKRINGKIELAIGIRNVDVDYPTKPDADCIIHIRKVEFTDAELKSQPSKVFEIKHHFSFNAGLSQEENFRFHLSSHEYIPQLNGYIVVTSTEKEVSKPKKERKFFGNALWFMSDAEIEKKTFNPVKISDKDFEPEMKAEGLCLISVSGNKYRLAIIFDNDYSQTAHLSKLYFYDLTLDEQTQSPQTQLP